MDVGVRELKQNLAKYLDLAERGETIRVTERGVPKAQLVAIAGAGRLAQGIDEGWVRPASRAARLAPTGRARAEHSVADTLREDRGE